MIASMYYFTIIITMVVFVTISSTSCQGFSVIQSQSSRTHPPQQQPLRIVGVSAPSSSSSSSLEMIFGRGNKNDAVDKEEKQFIPGKKINVAQRKKLGMNDDEEEYDLNVALENSTDPFISKLIAGSLIVSIFSLLIYAIVIPATTDYGEGVCNALLTGGRC